MKLLRFDAGDGPRFGRLAASATVEVLEGAPFAGVRPTRERIPLADVRLLAPVEPRRVFGIGLNYVNHIREVGATAPSIPMVFMKPDTAVIGPGAAVVYPNEGANVHYEAELAVVIGRQARRVPPERARQFVLGYTCANDISERVIQAAEMAMGALVVGKSFDTFCPLGPWIETDLDPGDLAIRARINGALRQDSRTSDLLFGVDALVSYLSQAITLVPGDVILTGTPAGVGPVLPGDTMDIEVEGIGVLHNTVVAEPRP